MKLYVEKGSLLRQADRKGS